MSDLKHWGIPGMKWGIRKSRPSSADHTKTQALKKKKTSELSNDEMKQLISRLQMEKQLSSLNPKTVGIGQKIFSGLVAKFGPAIIKSFIKKYAKVDMDDVFNADDVVNADVIDLKFLEDKIR